MADGGLAPPHRAGQLAGAHLAGGGDQIEQAEADGIRQGGEGGGQDKVWVDDPGGAPWEIYTVLADSDRPAGDLRVAEVCGPGACGGSASGKA